MTKLIFVTEAGDRTEIDAAPGASVMQAAVFNGIDGIVGECGGAAMCATCHVYLDPTTERRVPKMTAEEDSMLDSTISERRSNSRLSCQLIVGPELDGMIVRLPDRQI